MYPKLRFKGFDDAWEQRKLSDIGNIITGSTPSTKDKNNYNGDFLFVSPADIQGNRFVEKTITTLSELGFKKGRILAPKSTLFVSIGSTIGKVAQIRDFAVTNQQINSIEPFKDIDPDFVFSLMQKESPSIRCLSATQAVPILNKTTFSNVEVSIASNINEQYRIGELFIKLDSTITLHQRQCEVLKKQKQFFLQNMFPKEGESEPRIRFNGFTEPWEQRKLGELAPLRGGFAFKSEKFTTAGIPIVKISNILQDGSVGSDFSRYEMIPDDENFTLRNGDTVLAMSGATTGKVSVLTCTEDEKYYQNQRVGFFTRKGNFNYDFVSVIVRSHLFIEQLKSVLVAGAQPNVSPKDIDSFEFMVPQKFVEQEKIGHFFKSLDKLITLHQRQYEQLVSLKKYLLSKMFI